MARRTCFREQYYTGTRKYYSAGKIGVSNPLKLCVRFGWFFIDNFGLMCSFGLALFVESELIIPDQGMLVRSPGKSICKRLNVTKVINMWKMMNFSIGRRLRATNELFWANERVLTHSVERSKWLEELASESNTIQAQGTITRPGRLELQTNENYIWKWVGFSLITLDSSIRVGSLCLWNEIWPVSMIGNQSGARETPYVKSWAGPRLFNMW